MNDVIFGGKRITKRLTIALIALVALVLVAVLPVSATYYDINNTIYAAGANVYIGEQQLNLLPALTTLGYSTSDTAGWWASAATITTTNPSTTQPLSSAELYVSPADFGNYRATGI